MADFIDGRRFLIASLREELVGPCPQGKEIDCASALYFPNYDEAAGPYRQQESGEEILTNDRPVRRYGVGVLYPIETPLEDGADDEPSTGEDDAAEAALEAAAAERADDRDPASSVLGMSGTTASEDDDLPLTSANGYRPSSLGVSFLGELPDGAGLHVELTGGWYTKKEVAVARENDSDAQRNWWLRQPVKLSTAFEARKLKAKKGKASPRETDESEVPDGLKLEIVVISRPAPDGTSLMTVSAVNRSPGVAGQGSGCLFQTRMRCWIEPAKGGASPEGLILPYRTTSEVSEEDEVASLELLYREVPPFGVGHGCSADWEVPVHGRVTEVSAECLPEVEVPSITPEIIDPDTKLPIEIPMEPLADPAGGSGLPSLHSVVDGYAAWIARQRGRVAGLAADLRPTAERHLLLCEEARDRMGDGIAFLSEDENALEAFRLANRAMLLQQQRAGHDLRATTYDRGAMRITVDGSMTPDTSRGSWRPFQIAFVLAALRSTARGDAAERETVELIFFPTGGGKTEAYLALTAFSIFYRRLRNPADAGVDVLMRYTLRLLTAQQFQRASALICAMETLRLGRDDLGEDLISIGVWLGRSVTPNTRKAAVSHLNKIRKEGERTENPFVLLRCPWCATQMGPIAATGKRRRGGGPEQKVAGYERHGEGVRLCCPDQNCEFSGGLPVYVIDEDVYEFRPSLIIGTVDKFAMLAFRPQARSMFGLGDHGERLLSPPNLIIQDELHLISGPLGSMVGIYEAVIEELCTDRREEPARIPKIVGSTATIRRFEKQVRDLYARPQTALFPPRGLDAGDSYFARYARDDEERLLPGRVYVGIHAPGLGSTQTAQVRSFSSLHQAAGLLDVDEQDPWWTLLVFFNSLRELGTSLSLLQSDIPDYLRVIEKRLGLSRDQTRRPWNTLELTGRLRNDEIPRAIEKLEQRREGATADSIDVCLASNIVEVGIDIDRLSLMSVVGQPKSTSQYIQATGRIGRRWKERPGLVTTIYGASKPRDRSHFEKFRTYHERLYAQVEPTSVTPFAPPVLDRALHAVIVAYVRQLGDTGSEPYPVPEGLLEAAHELLRARVEVVDVSEAERFEQKFAQRLRQWRDWERTKWFASPDDEDIPLLRFAGAYATPIQRQLSWPVPTSLRNVDFECRAEITRAYLLEAEGK